jgi:hypothetical protein
MHLTIAMSRIGRKEASPTDQGTDKPGEVQQPFFALCQQASTSNSATVLRNLRIGEHNNRNVAAKRGAAALMNSKQFEPPYYPTMTTMHDRAVPADPWFVFFASGKLLLNVSFGRCNWTAVVVGMLSAPCPPPTPLRTRLSPLSSVLIGCLVHLFWSERIALV